MYKIKLEASNELDNFSPIYMNLQISVCQKSYFLCYQLVKSKLQLADSKWNMKVQQTSTKDANS